MNPRAAHTSGVGAILRLPLWCALAFALLQGCTADPPQHRAIEDWRDEIIYEVLVDRFANGDPNNDEATECGEGACIDPTDLRRFQGGDWQGLRERLDYIQGLGATIVWISPVVQNVSRRGREDGYHGYWATDFTAVNPHFGDEAQLRLLVQEAHARGLGVMVDVVLNHTGRVFDYDLNNNGAVDPGEAEPPYRAEGYDAPLLWHDEVRLWGPRGPFTLREDHFRRRGVGDLTVEEQKRYGDFPTGLRELDVDHPEVFEGLVSTYARWVERFDFDGFRVDVVPHMEPAFWPRFCRAFRERLAAFGKHNFLLLGEVFTADRALIAEYDLDDGIDAAFDLPLKFALFDSFLLDGAPATVAASALERPEELRRTPQPFGANVDPWQGRGIVFDNHDTWRFRAELDDDNVMRLALALLFTLDGIPALYYGTEQNFDGEGDGQQREPLWTSGYLRTDTYRVVTELTGLRRRLEALRRSRLVVRYASNASSRETPSAPDAGMLAFERGVGRERLLIVANGHPTQSSEATIPTGYPSGTQLEVVFGDATPVVVGTNGEARLQLSPRGFAVLAAR